MLYLIRKTEAGIVIAEIPEGGDMNSALLLLENSQSRAVVASEEFDIPLSDVLSKRLAKIFPELSATPTKPVPRTAVRPRPETVVPQEQQPYSDITTTDVDGSSQETGNFVVVDGKSQLADFDRARAAYVNGQEVGFATCTLCRGNKVVRGGGACPMCHGSGDITVHRQPVK